MSNKKIIVILGMHRSGTSLITRGLSSFGVGLGDDLLEPKPDNVKGFWEDKSIVDINESILKVLNSSWDSINVINADSFADPALDDLKKDAVILIREKVKTQLLFAFKDPRTSRLVPFWDSVFSEINLDPFYIIMLRHPLSVAKSLSRRDKLNSTISILLWAEYLVSSMMFTVGKSRLIVDYDLFMDDPKNSSLRLARKLNVTLTDSILENIDNFCADFLDNKLRHSNYSLDDLRQVTIINKDVTTIYTTLLGMAKDEVAVESKCAMDEFTKISLNIYEWSPLLESYDYCFKRLDFISQELIVVKNDSNVLANERDLLVTERNLLLLNLKRLTHEYDAVVSTISWKLTAPLRFIRYFFIK